MAGTPNSKTQIPEGWQQVRLGDVAEVARGISWSREQESSFQLDGSIPVVRIGNVQQDGFKMADTLHLRGVSEHEKSHRAVTPRTLVMVGSNGNRDRVGNVFLARPEVSGHLLASFLIGINPIEEMSERFLSASLRSDLIQSLITGSTAGSTGLKNLSLTWLRSLPILLPPLPEQRAIAAVLDSIDDAIERTESVIAATEQLRDSLLQQLLTRGVPGWHTEWKDVPGLGTIPADWEVVRLGGVIESATYGTNAQLGSQGAVAILRMNNLQDGEIDLSGVRHATLSDKESAGLSLTTGDILFNRTNSLDLVGKVAIVRDLPYPMSFASYLVRLRAKETLADPFWLSTLLWSESYQSRIRRFATPGVSQANINPTSLKSLAISLPPLGEQRTIARVLDGVDATVAESKRERDGLRLLKDSTADAILSGRVRVGQIS